VSTISVKDVGRHLELDGEVVVRWWARDGSCVRQLTRKVKFPVDMDEATFWTASDGRRRFGFPVRLRFDDEELEARYEGDASSWERARPRLAIEKTLPAAAITELSDPQSGRKLRKAHYPLPNENFRLEVIDSDGLRVGRRSGTRYRIGDKMNPDDE
jgi:hypothetical protein